MPIVLADKTIAIWFLKLSDDIDYMAGIEWADEESMKANKGTVKLTYRFRYYDHSDPSPWSEADRKSWYAGTMKDVTKEKAIENFREGINILEKHSGNKADELINNNGIVALMEEFIKMPWAHAKTLSEKEAEEQYPEEMKEAKK